MSEGLRKAALSLYRLSGNDRTWLLQQLPENTSEQLQTLIKQLDKLKIPKSPVLWGGKNNAIATQKRIEDVVSDKITKKMVRTIDRISVDAIKQALKNEPLWVIATVLSFYDWSWKEGFLTSLDISTNRNVIEMMTTSAACLNPTFQEVFVKALYDVVYLENKSDTQSYNQFEQLLESMSDAGDVSASEGVSS